MQSNSGRSGLSCDSEPKKLPSSRETCGYYRHHPSGFVQFGGIEQVARCGYFRHTCGGFTSVSSTSEPQIASDLEEKETNHRRVAPDGTSFKDEAACREYTYSKYHCFKHC